MTSSRYPQITDELLSAYIDDAVTKEEKASIETAMIDEPAIAWRLETLRYTINLLNSLPAVALPRSFALSEFQATSHIGAQTAAQSGRAVVVEQAPAWRMYAGLHNLGEIWRNFWQIGNLFLRNATAVSLAIFLVLVVSNEFVATTGLPSATMNRQSAANVTTVQSNEQSSEAQKILPTAIVQASTAAPTAMVAIASAGNSASQSSAQPTIASQAESAAALAAPASAASPVDTQVNNSSAASTVAEASEVAAAAVPQADAVRASAANSQADPGAPADQPGPDNRVLGDDGFAPSSPAANGPALPPSAAPSMQLVTPKTAASSIQSATNSPLMKTQAALQATAVLTEVATPTSTMTATLSIMAYSAQNPATGDAAQAALTLTPVATKLVTNTRVEDVQLVAASQANDSTRQWSWLALAQLMSAFATVILGALWWRSGEPHYRVNR